MEAKMAGRLVPILWSVGRPDRRESIDTGPNKGDSEHTEYTAGEQRSVQ